MAQDKLITPEEVYDLTSLGRSAIRTRELKGEFPKRITLSASKIAWSEREVLEWIEQQKEGRAA